MKMIAFLFFSMLFIGCNSSRKINRIINEKINSDTSARVYSLLQPTDKAYAYYITPGSKKILLQKITPEENSSDSVIPVPMASTAFTASVTGIGGATADDPFTGSVRGTVKTTYSTAANKTYATIRSLYNSLPTKEFMDALSIGHSDSRVAEEDKNVIVKKAWLYTITIEGDNDFHLLIGNTAVYDPNTTKVFNAEIPGVPVSGSAATKSHIRNLRAQLLTIFNGIPVCGSNGYLQQYTEIYISGSLFYDTQHKSTPAKCHDVEGQSAWEIHPVWEIRKIN